MQRRTLEIFLAVLERQNLTQASDDLDLSQPAVSLAIKGLEQELGDLLFERSRKGAIPTQAAKALAPHAKEVVAAYRSLQEGFAAWKGAEVGTLTIAASTTVGQYLLPIHAAKFQTRHPMIQFEIRTGNTQDVITALLDRKADLGYIEGPLQSKDFVKKRIAYDELVIVCSAKHLWAKRTEVTADDFLPMPMIRREKGSGTQSFIESKMNSLGYKFKPGPVLDRTEGIKGLLISGFGYSIMTMKSVEAEVQSGVLRVIDCDGFPLRRPLTRLWLKSGSLSPLAAQFLKESEGL